MARPSGDAWWTSKRRAMYRRITIADDAITLRHTLLLTASALSVAIDLLKNGGEKACWSKRHFRQTLTDFRARLKQATTIIRQTNPKRHQPRAPHAAVR